MTMTQIPRLSDKYRSLFLGFLLFFFSICAHAQTYNPSVCCTVSNKAYGAAQAVSTDGRSWFYDATNFVMRDYNGTTEVFSYLNLAKYRSGHFPVFVHTGGILQGNGVWLGGSTLVYWFKDSTGNANLVRWYTDSTGVSGGPFYAVANNLSEGNAGLIKGNLALDLVNNTSDAQKNAATVSLTNHTIDANNNTLLHIPNSALTNNSIGLTVTATPAADISVTNTPAALGTSLVINNPSSGSGSRGPLTAADWNAFHSKNDSATISNDSLYNWINGTRTLQSVIVGTGGVNSVNGTNASLLFSPSTGNVLGQVNPAFTYNWSGQHSFLSFAPIFSTLATNGGIFYGNGTGQLLQSGAGTSGQIFESNGGSAPTFFSPNTATVTGWLGYTPLSAALPSAQIFVGNGSNVATAIPPSGDWTINNAGVNVIGANKVTYGKIQAASVGGLLGASVGGNYGEITLGTNLSFAGSILNATSTDTTSLSARINAKPRIYNVVYGCGGGSADTTGVLDATSAIQSCILKADSAGGGDVYFPNGKYKIAGALQTGTGKNSQLYFPAHNPLTTTTSNCIRLIGESVNSLTQGGYNPSPSISLPVTTGVRLISTLLTGSGTTPAVIGCEQSPSSFCYTDIGIENMMVLVATNHAAQAPAISAINLTNASKVTLIKVVAALDTINQMSKNPLGSNTVGIGVSNTLNGGPNIIQECQSMGFQYGYMVSEHCILLNDQAITCNYGWTFFDSGYPISGHIMAHACNWDIYSPPTGVTFGNLTAGPAYLDLVVELERDSAGFWYDHMGEIKDSISYLQGMIRYVVNIATGPDIAIKQGALSLNLINAKGSIWEREQIIYSPIGGYRSGLTVIAPNSSSGPVVQLINDQGGNGGSVQMGGSTEGGSLSNGLLLFNSITGGHTILGTHLNTTALDIEDAGNVSIIGKVIMGAPLSSLTSARFEVSANSASSTESKFRNLNSSGISGLHVSNDANKNIEIGKIGSAGAVGGLFANNEGYIYDNDGLFLATNSQNLDISTNNGASVNVRITGATKNVLINTSTDVLSSKFTVVSTTQGTIPSPLMNTTQMNAISSPATGLIIYNTDSLGLVDYSGTAWLKERTVLNPSPLLKYQHSIFTPTTGGTVNLVNGQYNIINPAGALLALTLNLPSSPANNDVVYIKFTQNITTVTYANGTVVDGITAPTAGGLTILVYDAGSTSWY